MSEVTQGADQRRTALEEEPIDNLPEQPAGKSKPSREEPEEQRGDAKPLRESADTVRQLLDVWKQEYDETNDHGRKQELAYRIVKMGEAIQASHLKPEEVKIREAEPGVLGFYVPETREIAITPQGLKLPAEHFRDVLVHEATHAGKMTAKEIADEGVTQVYTRKRVPGAMHGIYEHEQHEAKNAFSGVGMNRVLEKYDFDRPKELLELYLETEWHDAWRDRWKYEVKRRGGAANHKARQRLLKDVMSDWTDSIERAFKDAAPRLLERAQHMGFRFEDVHERMLEELGTR